MSENVPTATVFMVADEEQMEQLSQGGYIDVPPQSQGPSSQPTPLSQLGPAFNMASASDSGADIGEEAQELGKEEAPSHNTTPVPCKR